MAIIADRSKMNYIREEFQLELLNNAVRLIKHAFRAPRWYASCLA